MRERVCRPLSLARVPTLPKRQGRSSVPTLSPNGVARLVRGTRNYTPLPRVLAKADGGERGFRGSLSVRQQPIADPFEGAVVESVSSTGRSSQVQLANRRGRVVVAGQRGSLLLAKVVVSASPRPSHGRKWHKPTILPDERGFVPVLSIHRLARLPIHQRSGGVPVADPRIHG